MVASAGSTPAGGTPGDGTPARLAARYSLLGASAVSIVALLLGPVHGGPFTTALVAVNLACLAGVVGLERRRPVLRGGAVLVACIAVLAAAAVCPVRRSNDVWLYAMYGRMVSAHGVSPYTHAPNDFPDDPYSGRVDPLWRDRPSVYGPLSTGVSAAVTALSGTSPTLTRLAFQGSAALALALVLLVIHRRTRSAAAVAVVGLHPATVVYTVGGGHNDALAALAVVGGVALAARGRAAAAGLALAAATLVKVATGLAFLPLTAWTWYRHGPRRAAALAAAGAVAVAAGYLLAGTDALRSLYGARGDVAWSSPWRWLVAALSDHGERIDTAQRWSTSILAGVVGLAALVTAGRARDRRPDLAVGSALAVYVLAAPHSRPWYLAWVLPLVAVALRQVATLSVLVWSAAFVLAAEATHTGDLGPVWFYAVSLVIAAALVADAAGRARLKPGRSTP